VNHPRRPFRINIGFLINQPIGYAREFIFDSPLAIKHDEVVLSEITGTAEFSRMQQGVRIQANFIAKITAECFRCLEDYKQDLTAIFEEVLTFKGHPLLEEEQFVPEDGYIDLESLLIEYLLLDLPIKQICREGCKGLCAVCGQNLNNVLCKHQKLTASKKIAG